MQYERAEVAASAPDPTFARLSNVTNALRSAAYDSVQSPWPFGAFTVCIVLAEPPSVVAACSSRRYPLKTFMLRAGLLAQTLPGSRIIVYEMVVVA